MGMNSKQIKERAISYEDEYEDAMDEAFNQEFWDFIKGYVGTQGENLSISECDVQGFMDSFTFPDSADWCYTQVDNELADIGDQQRDLERDREWEEQDEK